MIEAELKGLDTHSLETSRRKVREAGETRPINTSS